MGTITVKKYLSEFYTSKVKIVGSSLKVADPNTPLEEQIQAHVLAGNNAFFQSKYSLALKEYLSAWGLLPKFVFPSFPVIAVEVNDTQLLSVDMQKHLMEASVQILRLRDMVNPNFSIVAPINPPDQLVKISELYIGKIDKAKQFYRIGISYARIGEYSLAEKFIDMALKAGVGEIELQADGKAVLGLIELSRGNIADARNQLEEASRFYQGTQKTDGMTAMHANLGIALTVAGEAQEATKHFAKASDIAPANMKMRVNAIINSKDKAELPFFVKDSEGKWSEMQIAGVGNQPKHFESVIREGAAIQIDLQTQGVSAIENDLLQPRINATALNALETYLTDLVQFVSYLVHIQDFVLPLALGDTYFALGDYNKAAIYYIKVRDYKYLNLTIEKPMVWRKLARTYLQWGNRLYRDRDMAGAQAQYERIVQIIGGGYNLSGPLYEGGFASLKAETMTFLNAPNRLTFVAMDYARRIIILEALNNLTQILNQINYLGFFEDTIPIHSWRYLQNTARYFANQAIQAERAYINFKDHSEQEESTRLVLEQAVDAQAAALEVEKKRIEAAEAASEAASLNVNLAQTRLTNATAQYNDFYVMSQKLAYLDEIIAFTNASDRKVKLSQEWAALLGIELPKISTLGGELTLDTFKGNYLVQLLTRNRSGLTRDYELKNMQRQISEVAAAKAVADAQLNEAKKMVDVAKAQYNLADLRWQQAMAQLQFFNAQEFTPELWDNLAQAQRDISHHYLDIAIGAAFLMERAFEFEYDTDVNRIRFDYERSELHGLLAADFLLADIDQFSYDRLLETEKKVPVKVTISLADRYPYQFYQQFLKSGRIDFQTFLDDIDKWYPGAHLEKLRRVEVVVEGLITPQGLHGTITNSGSSQFRGRDGSRHIRIQKPETMVLSRFDLRQDGFIFTMEEGVLQLFENCGAASGWILEFPPESNDIDYNSITNIHLVLYFDAYYNIHVANIVRAEIAATAKYEYSLGLGLRFQYPDEFFSFQDTGTVTWKIDDTYLRYDHINPLIREAFLVIETEKGTPASGIAVNVKAANTGVNINQTTDANGMISTDIAAAPLNALRGQPLMDEFTVQIDEAANASAFAAGFTWQKVRNIYFFVEYTYTPRGRLIASNDFSVNPLPSFDVIDDPQAINNAPSSWSYNAANKRVDQTSNIHAPAGAANMTSNPNKPGTYLMHKISAPWPALRDFVARCHVNSGGNGVGMVFRFQDVDNFCFFLMDAQRNYRRLGKKVGGVFQELDIPSVDTARGYNPNQDYELTIAAVDDTFKVFLDGMEVLSGQDRSLSQPGRVGFYAWLNSTARFLDLTVQPA